MASAVANEPQSVFDRQTRIPDWDQSVIQSQVALVLGCGGLGCSVALSCCRLGFKKIILVDYDTVAIHNLNRQILFSVADVGKPKIDVAVEELRRRHVVDPSHQVIEGYNMNAVTNWRKIVELTEESTLIFNAIDGGTFRTTMTVDFYGPKGKPCWACAADVPNKELMKRLRPELIESYESIEFIPEDSKPVGASASFVAVGCAQMMVNSAINHICATMTPPGQEVLHFTPTRSIFYGNNIDLDKWPLAAEPKCFFCSGTDHS